VAIWYIFTRFGMLYQEKSGNTADTTYVGDRSHLAPERFQIFLRYNTPKREKYTKLPKTYIPNGLKIYKMTIK
jgi:hypothetical protein